MFTPEFSSAEEAFVAERSEEHTSELQSRRHLVCRLLLEKKKKMTKPKTHQAETTNGRQARMTTPRCAAPTFSCAARIHSFRVLSLFYGSLFFFFNDGGPPETSPLPPPPAFPI